MYAKAHHRAGQRPQMPALCDVTHFSKSEAKSCELVAANLKVLQKMDAFVFFEAAPDAMILLDQDGRIAQANSQTERMFGYRREELIGEPIEMLMPERFRIGHIHHRSRYASAPLARPMGAGLELCGLRKDGSEFPIEVSLSPLQTDAGMLVSSAIRDVSLRQRAEQLELQLEFEKTLSTISKTLNGLRVEEIESEIDKRLTVLAEVLDLDQIAIVTADPNEVSGSHAHWYLRKGVPHPPNVDFYKQFPWQAGLIARGQVFLARTPGELPEEASAEREYMLSAGVQSWLAIPLEVGGDPIGLISITSIRLGRTLDSLVIFRISAAAEIFAQALSRKREWAKLIKSEEQTRLAIDAANLAAWEWRLDRDEFWASENANALFGVPPGSKLTYEAINEAVHPSDREIMRNRIERAKDNPIEFRAEHRVLRPDGSLRWVAQYGRSYAKSVDKPYRLAGVSVDITDSKLAQIEIEQQLSFQKMLAEISVMFVNVPADDVHGQIENAQKRICEVAGLDRSSLVQLSAERDDPIVTHSWAAGGHKPFQNMARENLPWMAKTMFAGKRIVFARIDDLPEEAAKDKQTLRLYGPKSNVTFPLLAGGRVIGALAFESLREERDWPSPVVERLASVAPIFANALARAASDESLRQAYREIEQLKSRLEKENTYLRNEAKLEHHHSEVIGDSEGLRSVLKKGEQVAATDSTVLLLGETGTGKELIARTIHEHSRRKHRVMVKVNCATLPASLIESELFGREKGAFTGALTREVGRFELANGSTILLDEIGELPVELQSKLLRVLQEGEFERLGGPKTIKVDVRVIAATSRNLQDAVRQGKFREDLFYRLNVFPITIPPLRERREDIPALVWHFVNELGQRMGRSIETIHVSTMEAFKSYYWPGNVRELRNVIERFLITSTSTVFRAELPTVETSGVGALTQTFETVERNHILHILDVASWRVRGEGGAAQILGMKPTTLESRMQKLGIVRHK